MSNTFHDRIERVNEFSKEKVASFFGLGAVERLAEDRSAAARAVAVPVVRALVEFCDNITDHQATTEEHMAFFCPINGARIIAPGISKSAGGAVPEHDGSPEHTKAEDAAIDALRAARKSAEEIAASEEAKVAALTAALAILSPKSEVKAEPLKLEPKPATKPQGKGQ